MRPAFHSSTNHICIDHWLLALKGRLKVMATRAKMKARPVTLKHLAARLAEDHELTKRQGVNLLNGLVGLITKHLKKGERIRIAGFGILQVRKRPARMGRNPATGEPSRSKRARRSHFARPRN